MKPIWLVKCAAPVVALAVCSACGTSAITPSTAALAPSTAAIGSTAALVSPNRRAGPLYATIIPQRHVKSKTFEYVIDTYGSYAGIFDYPKSDKEIGMIDDVGGQGCTNVLYGYGKKTFWIVAADTAINEYEVPKKLIKHLSDSIGQPSSCAMDSSGDLAVGILAGSHAGDIIIFKNASGSGTIMTTPLDDEYFDGYDNQGNLFADGFHDGDFELVELPAGGSKFQRITTSNTVEFPGSVQWDGTYLTVTDQVADAIYRYTVSGTAATLEGTVSLNGASDCAQTWIVKGLVFCGDYGNNNGEVFDYPAGGSIVATFTGSFDSPLGVVAAQR